MITKEVALTLPRGKILYHRTLRNADGTAWRARVNGKVRTGGESPKSFLLPVKHGLSFCFSIRLGLGAPGSIYVGENWLTYDPTDPDVIVNQKDFHLPC